MIALWIFGWILVGIICIISGNKLFGRDDVLHWSILGPILIITFFFDLLQFIYEKYKN